MWSQKFKIQSETDVGWIIIWRVDHAQCIPWDRYRPPDRTINLGNSCLCVCPAICYSEWIHSKSGGTLYRSWYVSWAIYILCVRNAHTCACVLTVHAYALSLIFGWILFIFYGYIWLTTSGMGYVLFIFTHNVRMYERACASTNMVKMLTDPWHGKCSQYMVTVHKYMLNVSLDIHKCTPNRPPINGEKFDLGIVKVSQYMVTDSLNTGHDKSIPGQIHISHYMVNALHGQCNRLPGHGNSFQGHCKCPIGHGK